MQVQASQHDELRGIFAAEFDYVWRSLVRLGGSPADAEDLAQEVFVVVHRRLSTYDRSRPIRAWLFGIARNVMRDHRRLARHRHETIDPDADEARSDPAIRALEAGVLVRGALAQIPEPLREILILHDLDEIEMRDAADALEVPIDTAYARLRKGRELLRAVLRRVHTEAS